MYIALKDVENVLSGAWHGPNATDMVLRLSKGTCLYGVLMVKLEIQTQLCTSGCHPGRMHANAPCKPKLLGGTSRYTIAPQPATNAS